MSVRKRRWQTPEGEAREAWVVDYFDSQGKRRLKTFARKKDADAFRATSHVEVKEGKHVADRASVTVAKAAALWLATAEAHALERSTVEHYRSHVDGHIVPLIGDVLISKITVPAVRAFEDRLRAEGRSPSMLKRLVGSLGAIIADAQERGLATHNPVRDIRGRRRGKESRQEQRRKGKLKIGVDIPAPDEIKAFVGALQGRWRPLLLTAIFTGLRASELRGLTWSAVDLEKRVLHVLQRADEFNTIGSPKSEAGQRQVPLPPIVVNTLRKWKLACPKSELGLVFPNGAGRIESLSNILKRGLAPAMVSAGIIDDTGGAKYTGLHSMRHFYASWCINPVSQGGVGLTPKVVQERLGHSSITMTLDTYGHLFPKSDDGDELAAAERALLS